MVRRWSYLISDKKDYISIKSNLKPVLVKKGFKRTVRFKKSYSTLSKVLKKRYSFRKIKNSSFLLALNSFSWAKFYLNLTLYEKKSQFRKILPFSTSVTQSSFKACTLSNMKPNATKLMNFNSKSKKLVKSIRIHNDNIFFNSLSRYNSLLNFNWVAEIAIKSLKEILALRKIMVICILLQLIQKKCYYIKAIH